MISLVEDYRLLYPEWIGRRDASGDRIAWPSRRIANPMGFTHGGSNPPRRAIIGCQMVLANWAAMQR